MEDGPAQNPRYFLTPDSRGRTNPLLSFAVTRGIIRGIENQEDLETTQLSIRVTKLIRATAEDEPAASNAVEAEPPEIALEVPLHCRVGHGTGEFVFMARRKLGALRLQCAPRLEEWASLVNSLSREDKAHCLLRS